MSKHAEIANDRAIEFWEQKRFDIAITQWEKAVRETPNIADLHYNLGNAYTHQGQIEKAINSLKQAIAIDSTLVEAYNKLGCIYYKQGNLDLAFSNWRQALQIKPDFKEALHNLRVIQKRAQLESDNGISAYQHIAEEGAGPYELRQSKEKRGKTTWKDRARRAVKKFTSRDKDSSSE